MIQTKESVQNFLQSVSGSEISKITTASGGDWSQAFFFEVGGQSKVIRFSQADEDFLKDKFAYNFNSPDLPIPEIEEIGKAFDGYYAISPKIEGEMIDHLPKDQLKQLVPQVISLFNALRTVDLSDTAGYGGWNAEGKCANSSWSEFSRAQTNTIPSVG